MIFFFEHLENSEKHKAQAQIIDGKLWVHLGGQNREIELVAPQNKNSNRKGNRTAEPSQIIKSPMPGKITKVFIKIGDFVHIGDSVIVMEAMKMEYTLKAPKTGKIKSVSVATGDQVTLGKTLVEFVDDDKKENANATK